MEGLVVAAVPEIQVFLSNPGRDVRGLTDINSYTIFWPLVSSQGD
jgi:hypothetical protein